MTQYPDDAFRFEIPTPRGVIVVFAPSEMTADEIATATRTLCRVFPMMPVAIEEAAVSPPKADPSPVKP